MVQELGKEDKVDKVQVEMVDKVEGKEGDKVLEDKFYPHYMNYKNS